MKYIPKTNKQYKFNENGEVFSVKRNKFLKCSNGFYSVIFEHGRRNIRKQALIEMYKFLNMESKEVPNFSNYKITTDGKIYSLITNCWIKPFEDKDGYYRIALVNDEGVRIKNRVCRLVAITYLENENNLPIVNHIDEDKKNDHVDNLEWCSHQENVLHSKSWTKRKRDKLGRFI